jgi:hypothetical protein
MLVHHQDLPSRLRLHGADGVDKLWRRGRKSVSESVGADRADVVGALERTVVISEEDMVKKQHATGAHQALGAP